MKIVASLPCYSSENVDKQRGRGAFDKSIAALRLLNRLGYGTMDSRVLDLVYNPIGPNLPPAQRELEDSYRKELSERFQIEFDSLLTITNVPIKRFAEDLARTGQLEAYATLLRDSFNPETLPGLMCRSLISIDHTGRLFDCDFNQQLGLALEQDPSLHAACEPSEQEAGHARQVASSAEGRELSIFDFEELATLEKRGIITGAHCFACTAGAGSSCGGALA